MSELAIRRAATDTNPFVPAADVADLLSAIYDALDIPIAATEADQRRRGHVLDSRLIDVRTILNSALRPSIFTLREQAEKLREWAKQSPADYKPWKSHSDTGRAAEPVGGTA
jgi:hypothetical protein